MVLLVEFRIRLPLTLDEYHIAQLFAVAEASLLESDDDKGVKILCNEPFENERGSGQYTHKIFRLGSKMPGLLAAILPADAKIMDEKAWNTFPDCHTEYSHSYMKDRFSIVISSKHLPDAGTTENAFCLSEDDLARRRVVFLDIGNPLVEPSPEGHEPSSFLSEKTGRGNLRNGWWNDQTPIMCCYKLTSIKFQVFGLQYRIEEMVQNVFCTIDKWFGLTIEDIRLMEETVKNELDEKILKIGWTPPEGFDAPPSVKSDPF